MGFNGQHQQIARQHSKRNIHHSRSSDSSCLTGGFYTNPTTGKSINALDTLNITWDTTCLTPTDNEVDIYLYVPSASSPRIHVWEQVPFTTGYYEATLMPRWWNSTASEQLQLLIIQTGDAPFMNPLPPGPVFTATYVTPSTGTPEAAQTGLTTDSGVTLVSSSSTSSSSNLSSGKKAAAVIMPLLIVIAALAAWWWIKRSRAKGKMERKKWTEKVDQRMSVVSADWASISPAGAQAAIRNSMAIRASMDQQQRMSTMSMPEPNFAGMGLAPGGGVGGFFIPGQGDPNVNPIVSMPVPTHIPETTSPAGSANTPPLRLGGLGNGVGVGLRSSAFSSSAALAARSSRAISFAADPNIPGRASGETRRSIYERDRPSMESQRRSVYSQYSTGTRGSRAFHYSEEEEEMPPMPEGAAEIQRASAFYMLGSNSNANPMVGSNGVGSALGLNMPPGYGMDTMRQSHMNLSSSTLDSSANASRMSRFDEVYGVGNDDYSQTLQNNRSSGGDYSHTSYDVSSSPVLGSPSTEYTEVERSMNMSPDQRLGPVALSAGDIKKRIAANVTVITEPKQSFEEDVGPALSLMRAQEQEYSNLNQSGAQLRLSTVSETIFAASPSPHETSFEVPAFPMPPVAYNAPAAPASPSLGPGPGVGGFFMPTPSLNGAPIVSTTGPPLTYPATSATSSYTGMAPPKNGMSPDDMLRAYAGRSGSPAPSSPSSPSSPLASASALPWGSSTSSAPSAYSGATPPSPKSLTKSLGRKASLTNLKSRMSLSKKAISIPKISNPSPLAREVVVVESEDGHGGEAI